MTDTQEKSSTPALRILIVGAGIGGLTAAATLRKQGHEVEIFEKSSFSSEAGAAIHVPPNANGLLKRLGIDLEESGANLCRWLTEYKPSCEVSSSVNLEEPNKIWQHAWLLAHRVTLHNVLKRFALDPVDSTPGVTLHTSHKVTSVDPLTGTIYFENGNKATGDVILGADGVHSATRRFLPGAEHIRPFSSGKSAYRFLLNREDVLSNPLTKPYAEKKGEVAIWFGRDRRVVKYPTHFDTLLNFAAIFPDFQELNEEEGKGEGKGGWGTKGSREDLLRIYDEGWGEPVRAMLAMANESSLKAADQGSSKEANEGTLSIWRLWDMEVLQNWTHGKLALLGDAAHPFTPHQGQGGAVAIEDAAAIGFLLERGMRKDEVEDRLKLYEKVRMERAHTIQEFSRVLGKDLVDDMRASIRTYGAYNMGHDEFDNSAQELRKWKLERNPGARELLAPASYGLIPGPLPEISGEYTFTTASIRFNSSRTLLQNFFPLTSSSYRITSPGTVCQAVFSCTTYKYADVYHSQFGLYIPSVEYVKKDGEVEKGTYVPIVIGTHPGSENAVKTKTESDTEVDTTQSEDSYSIELRYEGIRWAIFKLEHFKEIPQEDKDKPENDGLLCHRYESDETTNDRTGYTIRTSGVEETIEKTLEADMEYHIDDLGDSGNTLRAINQRLKEIPVYKILEAKLVQGTGRRNANAQRRIE
ncbi:hypothetical protein ACMFMG_007330 [Clarireedia jacksonii]